MTNGALSVTNEMTDVDDIFPAALNREDDLGAVIRGRINIEVKSNDLIESHFHNKSILKGRVWFTIRRWCLRLLSA
jgi:hypothetical protein